MSSETKKWIASQKKSQVALWIELASGALFFGGAAWLLYEGIELLARGDRWRRRS